MVGKHRKEWSIWFFHRLADKRGPYVVCQLKVLLAGQLVVHSLHQVQDLGGDKRQQDNKNQQESLIHMEPALYSLPRLRSTTIYHVDVR